MIVFNWFMKTRPTIGFQCGSTVGWGCNPIYVGL
jgi:hypothetical protein